ncbi:hypothetical protein NLJ89_g3990 [Agrocybe chaxingu]|uniref:TECPR1-like DysF domain-containing protein n=1 Tax=Agrocybe chaxingu TaxID=84603 RepID=A0A9W8K3Q9_9AGAR|nr:hypothetical protein NLJ89_g3990 [Agrocybe chaxingu]
MATLDYVEIPVGATRLRSASDTSKPHDIRPAPKIFTSLPHPSPPSSPGVPPPRQSILSSTAASLASPTMSVIPQMLLSATLPPMSPTAAPAQTTPSSGKKGEGSKPTLMSSKDPLSLPIMTTNFKRFVTVIGPVFWLQDRIEEIMLWKRGWPRTAVWIAAYAFICFYPRVLLLLPHIILIGVILATYPYPAKASSDPLNPSETATPQPPAEASVPWQANIQGIQNLMGATADAHDLIEPYLYHLHLTPAHFSPPRERQKASTQPRSPYTMHILTLLTLSFFPLLFVIHLPWFPLREVCLVIGLTPFILTHPYVQALFPLLWPFLLGLWPVILKHAQEAKETALCALGHKRPPTPPVDYLAQDASSSDSSPPLPFGMVLQRLMDDDRLTDVCWTSELREVELWENERYGGGLPGVVDVLAMGTVTGSGPAALSLTSPPPVQKGWSKQNLRPGERTAWTRGRDGWSGVEGSGGEVSSNLTFSLAPGWAFVETEDWRKDTQCAWSGCGGDPDGWVYTNDAWVGPRPAPYTSGSGSVTRRRRWVRRVWYDPKRATEDS